MARLEQLENQIRALSTDELHQLRVWFLQFDAEVWDREFEADVASGKLDHLADRALQQDADGLSKDL